MGAVKKERDDLSVIAKRVTSLETINNDLTKKLHTSQSSESNKMTSVEDLKKCQAELEKMKKEHQVKLTNCISIYFF
jgi:hypothetical protein